MHTILPLIGEGGGTQISTLFHESGAQILTKTNYQQKHKIPQIRSQNP